MKLCILLVNLGTPDELSVAGIRKFLKNFLSDPRVVRLPRWIWLPLLHGYILRRRPQKILHAYQSVWTNFGSPLFRHTQLLADHLESHLHALGHTQVCVRYAMAYSSPSLRDVAFSVEAHRWMVIPLYPQYTESTVGSIHDQWVSLFRHSRAIPSYTFVSGYADHPAYIQAIAQRIQDEWSVRQAEHLVFSFHGLPKRGNQAYLKQCFLTAERVADLLNLRSSDYTVGFQSKFGLGAWLRPSLEEVFQSLIQKNIKKIAVVCPGFAADCLETLEEINIRGRQDFLEMGGEDFYYIPALNEHRFHLDFLTQLYNHLT